MSERPAFRLRPLEEKDLETVAVFEGEIAKISFPDDPITDVGFYVKKLKQLMANKDAGGFLANFAGLTRHIIVVQIPDRDNAMP